MQTEKTIGTHSGVFHLDEVLGCVMLTKYTSEFKDAKITRTRDLEKLKTFDLILDVGGKYEPDHYRFDHHQREFTDTFSPDYDVKLSSAGLIFKHFGKEIVKNIALQLLDQYSKVKVDLNEENVNLIYQRTYSELILYADAVDNGVNAFPNDVVPKYSAYGHLAQRVGRLNPTPYEENVSQDERFFEAMKIVDEELVWQLKYVVLSWLPSRVLMEQAFSRRFEFHESGEILILDQFFPWKEVLFDVEKKNGCSGVIKFVLAQDPSQGWRVLAVPVILGSFSNRRSLRKEWRGVAKEELAKVSRIEDIVFCHATGFIGGALSIESAMKMAILSLQE